MKFLNLVIPAAIVLAIYFVLYRPSLISDTTINQVASIEMLHIHIFCWWSAFLYLVFCLIISFINISRAKFLLVSGLGLGLASIILGFISGFIFAKQAWGIYFVWDMKFLMALLILFFTACLFPVSFMVDKIKFLEIGLRIGLILVLAIFSISHFVGYYFPAQHPNSAILNILEE